MIMPSSSQLVVEMTIGDGVQICRHQFLELLVVQPRDARRTFALYKRNEFVAHIFPYVRTMMQNTTFDTCVVLR